MDDNRSTANEQSFDDDESGIGNQSFRSTNNDVSNGTWNTSSPTLFAEVSPRRARNAEIAEPLPIPHRPSSVPQRRTTSSNHIPLMSPTETTPNTATYELPLRSIFVSGPPTASISANTALASLSAAAPSNGSGSFAALSNAGGSRRLQSRLVDSNIGTSSTATLSNRTALINTEKDVDDPNSSAIISSPDAALTRPTASLSKLFAATESSYPTTPARGLSHLRSLSGVGQNLNDTSTLTGHLFRHGFTDGKHSDITVRAFGESYKLHKLLLDRVPFFSSAFSGSWAESSANEMTLHPEDIDSNITKIAFELAIKRIYGTHFPILEDQEAIGLFATACWLDMPDLVDSCVESILRQMKTSTLYELILLVTKNNYGKAGDRILSSAKAMLYREGWEMPYEYWDNIPAEIVKDIIGGDPFFVPSEWERWLLAVKLLNRRLKAKATEGGLLSLEGEILHRKPTNLAYFSPRFESMQRRDSEISDAAFVTEKDQPWTGLYSAPEIAPLLELLDGSIHYVHLRFEQLQQIRTYRDLFGVPILPEKVISDALWMSMELRQRILNAQENDLELGLMHEAEDGDETQPGFSEERFASAKGKQREHVKGNPMEETLTKVRSRGGDAATRRFWIPTSDVSCIMGGTREANNVGIPMSGFDWDAQSAAARSSANLEPLDSALSETVTDSVRQVGPITTGSSLPRYSRFPPFRFSAEFPHPRTLKEKKRVYSQTVWYAGSMWNLYIQRVNTAKSHQLGIYLHRAKDTTPLEDPLAQIAPATVDDRIGQLEREMLLRKTEQRHRQWRIGVGGTGGPEIEEDVTNTANVYSTPGTFIGIGERLMLDIPAFEHRDEGSESAHRAVTKSPQDVRAPKKPTSNGAGRHADSDVEDEDSLRSNRRFNVPALPPYLDSRPVIKTYFKIYSPDRAGRVLSIFESAPEKFVVSKSWGWKSSQLGFDDGMSGYDTSRVKDGKLRYMVVIGNV